MGEQNEVCLMIINSEISACQLIRYFLGMCAPLFICWARLSAGKYPRCTHCMSKPLHTSLAAGEPENKDPSKADSFQEQASVFVCRADFWEQRMWLLEGFTLLVSRSQTQTRTGE